MVIGDLYVYGLEFIMLGKFMVSKPEMLFFPNHEMNNAATLFLPWLCNFRACATVLRGHGNSSQNCSASIYLKLKSSSKAIPVIA
jgi:hypothetical protein